MNHIGVWSGRSRNNVVPLILVAATVVSALFLFPITWIAVAALLGVVVILYLVASMLDGKVEVPLLFWVAVFPLGYYFVPFPRERAIITFDRIMVGVVLVGACLVARRKATKLAGELRRSAVAWGFFLLAAFASVRKAPDVLTASRTAVDGFLLPALLGWIVIASFDARRHMVGLHVLTCVMAIYVAAIGGAEMATGSDIMPLPGAGTYFAGSIPRPNGPFNSNNSFALIGLISFLFLLFLRHAIGKEMLWWQRLLHKAGMASALATALMPLFRSVAISLLIILLLGMYFDRSLGKVAAGLAILVSAIAALTMFSLKAPDAFEDRSDRGNLYSRIAEQRQTFELFKMHPFTGVGLANFVNVAEARSQSVGTFQGYESVDSPHNNLGAILAETGLMGFVPYVAAQVLLIMAFRKLRTLKTHQCRTVWIFFLYVFLGYWISGLSLTAGYYSDLNLWYMFVLMVLYKYAITEESGSWIHADTRVRSLP
jgi:O-antigen ligase